MPRMRGAVSSESWLQPHLEAVLRKRCAVLSRWRDQLPTLQGRTKNFENWVLVELVHEVLETGFVREVRTNGHFGPKVKRRDVRGLSGSKSKAKHLSADFSVRLPSGRRLSAEIKTGLAPKELLNDLRIVQHYNNAGVADRAELGWVVLLPKIDKTWRSCMKTFEKTCAKVRDEFDDFLLKKTNITNWLILCVAVPVRKR
ncbi:MAG: hypothetical protein ACRDGM_20150 [bacterium]